MHDALFVLQRELGADDVDRKAASVGIDALLFRRCVEGSSTAARVEQHLEEARELQVSSTPAFFFGGLENGRQLKVLRRESGAIPARAFAKILDDLLRSSR